MTNWTYIGNRIIEDDDRAAAVAVCVTGNEADVKLLAASKAMAEALNEVMEWALTYQKRTNNLNIFRIAQALAKAGVKS